jgi:hypothetical protein
LRLHRLNLENGVHLAVVQVFRTTNGRLRTPVGPAMAAAIGDLDRAGHAPNTGTLKGFEMSEPTGIS